MKVASQDEVLDTESFSSLRKLRNVVIYLRKPFRKWKQQECNKENAAQENIRVEEPQEVEEWLIKQEQKNITRERYKTFQTRNHCQKCQVSTT